MATPPKGGEGRGQYFFFLEAQFTPLSPDISIISVSQTVIFLENKNWNNRGIPRDRVLKSPYFDVFGHQGAKYSFEKKLPEVKVFCLLKTNKKSPIS